MFGLSYLFYPWGFIVQILAIVHFVRRRPENYWFYIIFFGGLLGASVYILAGVLPDMTLLRGVWQGFGRRSRIQTLETQILDNPSAANYEELGELYKDQRQYEKARDAFNHAIAARSDSIYTFYSRAQSSLGMNDLAAAIPDLARVGTEAAGEKAHSPAVYAEARAAVVPQGQGAGEGACDAVTRDSCSVFRDPCKPPIGLV